MIRRLFYGAAALLLVLLFLLLLHGPLKQIVPEVDLWWMQPAFSYHLESRSGWRLWLFLLGPEPNLFAFPVHKVSLWLLEWLRLPLRAWGYATALIHVANSLGLAWLCRGLGLSRRASYLAGITFLSLFVHFHSIVWLPASQHVLTLSAILSTLLLFLTTERRIQEGRPGRLLYGLTLVSTVAASLQNAAMLAPLLMGAYLLIHPARTHGERMARYLRWVPVLFAACLYPVVAHSFSYVKPLISVIAEVPMPPALKALGLLLGVAGLLAALGAFLHLFPRLPRAGQMGRISLAAGASALVLLLALRDSRQVLLPYHALVPFTAVLSSFLNPFSAALKMDSATRYHYVPAGLSAANLSLAVLLIGLFTGAVLRHKRRFLLFGAWYAAVLLYLLLHRHVASSMPFYTQSRYAMYVTPVFCVIFCSAAVILYLRLARRIGLKGWRREALLVSLFAFFWVPNLLAIPVALLRGRLVGTYYLYDDIRAVRAIQRDLIRQGSQGGAPGVTTVGVEGVAPLAFHRKWNWPVPPEQVQYRLFRRLAEEAWGEVAPVRRVRLNEAPAEGPGVRTYRLREGRVVGPGGPVEEFESDFEAGVEALRLRRYPQAAALLEAAARRRPFLLNYLLTPRGRLSDLQWIIGGGDLEDWLNRLGRREKLWSIASISKWESVRASIRREMEEYRRCLFLLGYLRWREDRRGESLFWLSRLRLLESDVERLVALLREDPFLASDPAAAPFLAHLQVSFNGLDRLPWRKNDYGFGRWLLRVVAGWDIRSRWDRQFPEPP